MTGEAAAGALVAGTDATGTAARPRRRRGSRLLSAGAVAAMLTLTAAACGGDEEEATGPVNVTVTRDGGEVTVPFSSAGGEVVLDLKAASPEASWDTVGRESAVVSLFVDDSYATDLVIPASFPIERSLALGSLRSGEHTLRALFAADRSPAGTKTAQLTELNFRTVTPADPGFAAAQYAPVVYGRSGETETPGISGPFQNAVTDTPLLAFHTEGVSPTSGNRVFTYSIVWSNEDGGTPTPALFAQWGRSTDIEWVYQVEVDSAGQIVPGTAVVQGQEHSTVPFTGEYEGTHPVIQICALNNSVCGRTDGQMRFTLSAEDSLDPATEARERVMDRHPWTYWVMAQEIIREGKTTEVPSDPTTYAGDPRSYLYLVVRKSTVGQENSDQAWVGLSIGVKLAGNPTIYRSDLGIPALSLQRDLPAATAIALPPGTVAEDIEQIRAIRVVGAGRDTQAKVQVESIEQGFFLDAEFMPQQSFLFAPVQATLTAGNPVATLLDRANGPIVRTSPTDLPSGDPSAGPTPSPTSVLPGITIGPSLPVQLPTFGAATPTTPPAAVAPTPDPDGDAEEP